MQSFVILNLTVNFLNNIKGLVINYRGGVAGLENLLFKCWFSVAHPRVMKKCRQPIPGVAQKHFVAPPPNKIGSKVSRISASVPL